MSKFSVLLPVYKNDTLKNFKLSVESAYKIQTVKPNEVIIVRDGPVPDTIQKFLNKLKKQKVYKIIELKENKGLSNALNTGLKHCKSEIVARVDADDICLKNRFKEQLKMIKEYDIVGSFMQEFDSKNDGKILKLPITPKKSFATLQTPIWHPSVMYKKTIIQKIGGYEDIYLFEDYLLWAKLFMENVSIYNIPKVLVKHRMDEELFGRRSGLKLFFSELKLQRIFLKIGFTNYFLFIRNIGIRGLYRFFPIKLKQFFSKKNIKQKIFK